MLRLTGESKEIAVNEMLRMTRLHIYTHTREVTLNQVFISKQLGTISCLLDIHDVHSTHKVTGVGVSV